MTIRIFFIFWIAASVFGIFNGPVAGISNVYRPALTLDLVENRDNTYALYITYTGGDASPKYFYCRDSLKGDIYRLLPTMWGIDDRDAVGIIVDEETDPVLGHRMKLKAYFDKAAAERDVYITVMNEDGSSDVPAVHVKLEPRTAKPAIRYTAPRVTAAPRPKAAVPDKFSAYQDIAERTGGELIMPRNVNDIPAAILSVIERTAGGDIDLVFVIDDTGSMYDDAAVLRTNISRILDTLYKKHTQVRLGLLLYRDVTSEYLTRPFPFTARRDEFIRNLGTMKTIGGDDEPEAVLEALEAAFGVFEFKAKKRVVIVMGDAPPHAESMSKVDSIIASAKADDIDIKVFLLGLPGESVPQKEPVKIPAAKKAEAQPIAKKPERETAPGTTDEPAKTAPATAKAAAKETAPVTGTHTPAVPSTPVKSSTDGSAAATSTATTNAPAHTEASPVLKKDTPPATTPSGTDGGEAAKTPTNGTEPSGTMDDGMNGASPSPPDGGGTKPGISDEKKTDTKKEEAKEEKKEAAKAEPAKTEEAKKKDDTPPKTTVKPKKESPDNADW